MHKNWANKLGEKNGQKIGQKIVKKLGKKIGQKIGQNTHTAAFKLGGLFDILALSSISRVNL